MTGTVREYRDEVNLTYRNFERSDRQLGFNNPDNYVNKQSETREGTNEQTKLLEQHKQSGVELTAKGNMVKSREASNGRKAFILVACLLLHFISGGIAVALGVIYVDLVQVFESSHSEAALVQSIFMGTMIAGGVIFTSVLQKYGTGIPGIITSVIAGLAFLAAAFAPNVPTLIALVGVIGGLSMGMNYLSAFVCIGWTFQENRKTALALLSMGWTFGQTVFPYFSQYLVDSLSWYGCLMVISGIVLNCVPCGVLMWKSQTFFLTSTLPSTNFKATVTDCLKDYLFVLFLIIGFFYACFSPVETWFIVDLAVVRGFERSIGALLLSLLGLFGFVGRILGALFLKIFKSIKALVHFFYAILIFGVAHFLVGYFRQVWGLVLAVLLRGIAEGIINAVMPGGIIELRGIDRFPQTVAIVNMIGGVASILGGLVGGVTVDLTAGYEFIFTLAAVVFLVCAVFFISVWLLSKRQRQKIDAEALEYKTETDNQTEKESLIHSSRHE